MMKALQKSTLILLFGRAAYGLALCIGIWAERGLRFTLFRVTEVVEMDYRNKSEMFYST